jgi:hypothetical protein
MANPYQRWDGRPLWSPGARLGLSREEYDRLCEWFRTRELPPAAQEYREQQIEAVETGKPMPVSWAVAAWQPRDEPEEKGRLW